MRNMKNVAFIEWDKKLSSGDQRPRGIFFRQKFASVNRHKLAESPYYQRIKYLMKVQRKASRNKMRAPGLDFINPNYIQAAIENHVPDLFVSMHADGSATYTIEEPAERGFENLGYSSSEADQLKKMISANADVVVISGKTMSEAESNKR